MNEAERKEKEKQANCCHPQIYVVWAFLIDSIVCKYCNKFFDVTNTYGELI